MKSTHRHGLSVAALFLFAILFIGCGPKSRTVTVNREISVVNSATPTRNFVPNDEYYAYSAEYLQDEHHLQAAWRFATGRGITIAILDAGQAPHEDMKDAYDPNGYDFVYDDSSPYIGEREVREAEVYGDVMDHGTTTASCAGARGGNGIGIVGTAPDCKILPLVTYTQDGRGSRRIYYDALDYARLRGARVISMSFSGPYVEEAEIQATYRAAQAGIILVASAGNKSTRLDAKSTERGFFPGSYPWVINVGATKRDYTENGTWVERASFSNYGDGVDIYCRGQDVLAATGFFPSWEGSGYEFASFYELVDGTSFAGPMVAGVIACALEIRPDLNVETIRALLRATADELPGEGRVLLNAGRFIQTVAALPEDGIMPSTLPLFPPGTNTPSVPGVPFMANAATNEAELANLFSAQARAERQQSLFDPKQQVLAEWAKPRRFTGR